MLRPTKKAILVEPVADYEHVVVTEAKYDTKTKGKCIAIGETADPAWLNNTVYFPAYKDDAEATYNGKKYVFIEVKDVLGFDDGDDLKAEEL